MIEGKAIETFKGGNIGDTRIYIWCTTRVTVQCFIHSSIEVHKKARDHSLDQLHM